MDNGSSYTEEQEMAGWPAFQRNLQEALDSLPPALDAEPPSAAAEARDV